MDSVSSFNLNFRLKALDMIFSLLFLGSWGRTPRSSEKVLMLAKHSLIFLQRFGADDGGNWNMEKYGGSSDPKEWHRRGLGLSPAVASCQSTYGKLPTLCTKRVGFSLKMLTAFTLFLWLFIYFEFRLNVFSSCQHDLL